MNDQSNNIPPLSAASADNNNEAVQPDPMSNLLAASQNLAQLQHDMMKQMMTCWSGIFAAAHQATATAAQQEDRRFPDESWGSDPRFDVIRRAYLAYSNFVQDSVDFLQTDEKTKAQLRFGVRQFVDAVSPANFFVTNPEAIRLAMESGGRSLTEGMAMFLQDVAKGRISTNDECAFEVGKNIATTEGAVVFENDLIQLIQYTPLTADVHARPLLIVPPCINKYYILDLQPGNSLVRYAVEQGHTVFVVSWRNVPVEFGHLTWDDYLTLGVLRAIEAVLDITGVDKINTLGFCIGGTLLASALATMKKNRRAKIASMTLLTAMLDFCDTGDIGLMVDERSIRARELAIGGGGVMEGKELAFVFSSLRANDLIWPYVVNNYLKGQAPSAFDLLYWNADSTNLPGPMFCWYVRNTYLENNLRVPGATIQCGVPVNLSKIDCPTYLYGSREDHIVPWRTAYATTGLVSGETTFVLGASGHIAGVINPASKNKRNYWISEASNVDADAWLAGASSVPGSWWTHWSAWLARQAGEKVPARTALGSAKYPSIEPAPGRYVKEIA